MEHETTSRPGEIVWVDLTVPNTGEIHDFYHQVAGWQATEEDMGGYADYQMREADTGPSVAGISYRRGVNAQLPPHWLIYILIENLDDSIAACRRLGGSMVDGPREGNGSRLCVIQDPARAFVALYQVQR